MRKNKYGCHAYYCWAQSLMVSCKYLSIRLCPFYHYHPLDICLYLTGCLACLCLTYFVFCCYDKLKSGYVYVIWVICIIVLIFLSVWSCLQECLVWCVFVIWSPKNCSVVMGVAFIRLLLLAEMGPVFVNLTMYDLSWWLALLFFSFIGLWLTIVVALVQLMFVICKKVRLTSALVLKPFIHCWLYKFYTHFYLLIAVVMIWWHFLFDTQTSLEIFEVAWNKICVSIWYYLIR